MLIKALSNSQYALVDKVMASRDTSKLVEVAVRGGQRVRATLSPLTSGPVNAWVRLMDSCALSGSC